MNKRSALAISALSLSFGANADILLSNLGQLPGSFVQLTQAGLSGTLGHVAGGDVYYVNSNVDVPAGNTIAAIPVGSVFEKGWIAAGVAPSQPSPAILSLGSGVVAVSFLWGSPDSYNSFAVTGSVSGLKTFDVDDVAASVSAASLVGDRSLAYYVRFVATGETIQSITLGSATNNAIEVSNVTTMVPEPEAYGLAMAGMGVVAFAMRRRRAS